MAVLEETCVGADQGNYYDPTTAQFLTPDPLYAITGERYGYAGNDPINDSDPTGLCGFLGNGPCTPGGIAKEATNDTIKVATGGQANCVMHATCPKGSKSLATLHPHVRDALYGIAGGAALVASGGALLELAPLVAAGSAIPTSMVAEGVATAGFGGFAALGDYGKCFHDHDRLACAGFYSGAAGAVIGLGAAFAPGDAALALGGIGLAPGGAAFWFDTVGGVEDFFKECQ